MAKLNSIVVSVCAAVVLATVAGAQTVMVLDPLAVGAHGNPAGAVVTATVPGEIPTETCDVVVIGAGLGGSSAAMTASQAGNHVCMTESTHWIGGQITSQGVSALDENKWITTTGATASYTLLGKKIVDRYRVYTSDLSTDDNLNPGNCWVSRLCFEPPVGLKALEEMLQPMRKSGKLSIHLHAVPARVEKKGNVIESVIFLDLDKKVFFRLRGSIFIDATELGEFLPLAGADYVIGAESKAMSQEPDAPANPNPKAVQSFTYTFILHKGSDRGAVRPDNYEENLHSFSLDSVADSGATLHYHFFDWGPGTYGPFWTYRRSVDATQFNASSFPSQLSLINWPSNDVCDAGLLSDSPEQVAEALQRGKQVSLGFAWWITHEVPRDDGRGKGYPDLAIERSEMGTQDGLSQFPYVREARRILALQTIREQDIAPDDPFAARAVQFENSVGIGYFPMDLHGCGLEPHLPTAKPYQVPLAALMSRNISNLMAVAKNIGTTHFTNGAYRLHPTEWAVGVAAGMTAHQALATSVPLHTIATDSRMLRRLQVNLIQMGQPLVWFDDIPVASPLFVPVQAITILGLIPVDQYTLHFSPDRPVSVGEAKTALAKLGIQSGSQADSTDETAVSWEQLGKLGSVGKNHGTVSRGAFAKWIWEVAQSSSGDSFNLKKENLK